VNWISSPKPRSVAARLEQFPLGCVCLSTTTRPRSASRPIFVGRAIERTARSRPTAPFNEGVRPFSTQARKGAGSVSFVTRSGRRRLSSVVQLTTAHFSLLLPPTRRSLSHLPFLPISTILDRIALLAHLQCAYTAVAALRHRLRSSSCSAASTSASRPHAP
jgi:hypothetical protein